MAQALTCHYMAIWTIPLTRILGEAPWIFFLVCPSHLRNLNISIKFACLQRWWRNRALDVCPSEEITIIIK